MYGIECSGIAEQAKLIVSENGYSEQITIIQGKVEVVELPVKEVRMRDYYDYVTRPSSAVCRSRVGAVAAAHGKQRLEACDVI